MPRNLLNNHFLLAAFALFVIFAILAIRLFGNKLYACNDSSITTGREDCFGNFVAPDSGILMPRVWDRPDYNFDSLGKVSLLFLQDLLSLSIFSKCGDRRYWSLFSCFSH